MARGGCRRAHLTCRVLPSAASLGSEPGTTFVGVEAVRDGLRTVIASEDATDQPGSPATPCLDVVASPLSEA